MRILGLNGSPDIKGNSRTLLEEMKRGASENGHEMEIVDVYSLDFKGCRGCMKCKKPDGRCVLIDDMQDIYEKIESSDVLALASPVYFGHITGEMKKLIDRWCVYFDGNFNIRYIGSKKYAAFLTSGAPTETYRSVSEYLHKWLGDFFKLECVGSILEGGMMDSGVVKERSDVLKRAYEIGKGIQLLKE